MKKMREREKEKNVQRITIIRECARFDRLSDNTLTVRLNGAYRKASSNKNNGQYKTKKKKNTS